MCARENWIYIFLILLSLASTFFSSSCLLLLYFILFYFVKNNTTFHPYFMWISMHVMGKYSKYMYAIFFYTEMWCGEREKKVKPTYQKIFNILKKDQHFIYFNAQANLLPNFSFLSLSLNVIELWMWMINLLNKLLIFKNNLLINPSTWMLIFYFILFAL